MRFLLYLQSLLSTFSLFFYLKNLDLKSSQTISIYYSFSIAKFAIDTKLVPRETINRLLLVYQGEKRVISNLNLKNNFSVGHVNLHAFILH